MKLWEKNIQTDKWIENFTIGRDRELDLLLAPYDIMGNIAHCQMLQSIGLLTQVELQDLLRELEVIANEIDQDRFEIEPNVEDVHSQIELLLTKRLGDVGKKIHMGRSRNDQILLDLKLFYRDKLSQIISLTSDIFDILQEQSEQYKEVLMPGYTHMQIGMISSFGLWYGSYAEALIDDMDALINTRGIVDQNPLGSAAGYGNSFPLDREMTTELLNFRTTAYNSIYAQFGRGKCELFIANAFSTLAYTLGKFAMDVVSFCGQNFKFITLPDEITTGSSIMPHKKNPDVFELIRAKCNSLQSLPAQILAITSNLPSGYHRDFQQLKEVMLPAFENLMNVLEMVKYTIPLIKPNQDIMNNDLYDHLYTVESVNQLVLDGMPFRDAYQNVAKAITEGSFIPDKAINHQHIGSIGKLGTAEILAKKIRLLQRE